MADRQAKDMSPMFLGGLTARAIALSKEWRKLGIAVHEAYPAALIRQEWDMLKVISGRTIPIQVGRNGRESSLRKCRS